VGHRRLSRAEDHLAPNRAVIDAGGVPLPVREWGEDDAPALLFWPGLNAAAPSKVDDAAGPAWANDYGFHVLAISPPGWETAPLPARAYRTSELARLVVDALDGLALERAAFAGFSWGASIGCHVGALAPERLTGLALLDAGYTNFQDQPDFEPLTLEETTERVRAGGAALGGVAAETIAAAWFGVVDDPPAAAVPALASNDVPILLVTASQTIGADWAAAALGRFLDAVPRTEVQEVESSHDLLADAPAETIKVVGEWLAQRAGVERLA
jgi:pimeloyl-ACP methyl ester carboxylesterase